MIVLQSFHNQHYQSELLRHIAKQFCHKSTTNIFLWCMKCGKLRYSISTSSVIFTFCKCISTSNTFPFKRGMSHGYIQIIIYHYPLTKFTPEFLENLEEIFPWYYYMCVVLRKRVKSFVETYF